jgi:hypothetical protein
MSYRKPSRRQARAFSLVELLVVAVILVLIGSSLAYFYLGSGGKGKNGEKKTPISAAKSTVCNSNLKQVRQAIEIAKTGDTDELLPQSLTELKLPSELLRCDVGKEPYQYDSQTGTVRCLHPGHENF